MDTSRCDQVIQFALLEAGRQDDFTERELGPIHLLKYVYLADLEHAERRQGETFTGAQWTFYHYGPWAQEVHQPFLDRIRACEYPQFLLDSLPLLGATESVLRLDHVQLIGRHHDSYSATNYCLSGDAIDVVDEWLGWLNTGQLCEDALLADIRTELLNATP